MENRVPIMRLMYQYSSHRGISYNDLQDLPYWEFEEYIEMLNHDLKKEKDQQQSQQAQHQAHPKTPKMKTPNVSQQLSKLGKYKP